MTPEKLPKGAGSLAALLVLALLAALAAGPLASGARADGDPGSDVLVYQPLFFASDAGLTVSDQVRLDRLLGQTAHAGFPIRVAIISSRFDLGAITGLWRQPQAYAKFLGVELSLAYKQRLLVVMPNGLGINWPGHPVAAAQKMLTGIAPRPGGAGLAAASVAAVHRLAAARGVKLPAPTGAGGSTSSSGPAAPRSAVQPAGTGSNAAGTIVAIMAALAAIALALRFVVPLASRALTPMLRAARWFWTIPGVALLAGVTTVALLAGVATVALLADLPGDRAASSDLANNPNLDPGTTLAGRPAPDFKLYDQFGQPVSMRQYRGKVVILAFTDSQCTTICPLSTSAMLDAKRRLGAAGSRVQLLGVDANPKATAVDDVLSYSQLHGLTHAWRFATGSAADLARVWRSYGISSDIQRGVIDHTPALFVIDTQGRLRKLYMTQQSYTAIDQLGQLVARESSSLLPGHPHVAGRVPYSAARTVSPRAGVTLPRAGGGEVRFGPGVPHLYLFFDTWDREVTSLAGQLDALNGYGSGAASLPKLTAVDEGSVEPDAGALSRFLATLSRPLSYPVAIDRTGQLADGYEVQDEPWLVLTSAAGKILWYHDVSVAGWPSSGALDGAVRAALSRTTATPSSLAEAQRKLVGSPAPLAALHAQASRVIGSQPGLAARIRALRGYPIVVNAWASWCVPCRAEFPLFAGASARYGQGVAFLGADVNDQPGDAEAFLRQHPVSYPSWSTSRNPLPAQMPGGLLGTPTSIFVDKSGRVHVHTGPYESQGTLDADVRQFALGG